MLTFDKQSGVPHDTVAHPDGDVLKVVGTVMQHQLLTPVPRRKHTSFPTLHLDPLHKWDIKKARKEESRVSTLSVADVTMT